jgi:hypothetical protein
MATEQLFTIGWLSAAHRIPPAVVESLIKTAGIEPRFCINTQRQFAETDLLPVYAGIDAYLRGHDPLAAENIAPNATATEN